VPDTVFHITTRKAWEAALTAGVYRTDSLDAEGFIHCSAAHQAARVANTFFRGQTGLVLLGIELSRLHAELRFEPPALPAGSTGNPAESSAELFPHLYGPLNLDAVTQVVDFPPGPDGTFELPAEGDALV
jgi:uncharacterized protein (DUF952 family)